MPRSHGFMEFLFPLWSGILVLVLVFQGRGSASARVGLARWAWRAARAPFFAPGDTRVTAPDGARWLLLRLSWRRGGNLAAGEPAPELRYVKFTGKEHTLRFATVLQGN